MDIGAASTVITNELGTFIQGATCEDRAEFVRDELEANALYLQGATAAVLLISCDLGGLLPDYVGRLREAIAAATGIDSRAALVSATHSGGPSVLPTNYLKPLDSGYLERLSGWLVTLAKDAMAHAAPGRLAWGQGAARIGYNRRCCWADGTHTMHGDVLRSDFTGLEGPHDNTQVALFATDLDDRLIAITHYNTAHPNTFYGANFYSADYPGEARRLLRSTLGEIPVLFLNGSLGDILTENMLAAAPTGGSIGDSTARRARETAETKLARTAYLLAGETLRLWHDAQLIDTADLAHLFEDVEVGVRLPTAERLSWAREILARVDQRESVETWDRTFAHGVTLLQEEFATRPIDVLPVHALRIGEVAFVFQPTELFCQFGLDIRRRSPAPITAVCSITDGYHGYCPTMAAVVGGGYSGEPIWWTRFATDAGYLIVDCASRLLHQLYAR